jgi:uncharacterized membrane protein YkvA (DUF1232 family)
MSDNRSPTVYNDNIFRSLVRQLRLTWRLLRDPRVHWMAKSLPIIAGIYVVSPIDLIMGIPVLSGMDDLAVAVLGLKMFIEFCPPEVVQEHLRELEGPHGDWEVADDSDTGGASGEGRAPEVVEGEYSVVEDES